MTGFESTRHDEERSQGRGGTDRDGDATAQLRVLECDGAPAIGYREAGAGPALVFLHGLAGSSRSFAGQLARFAASHRAVAWDAPGYGASGPVEARVDVYAWTVVRLLDGLGIDQAVLVGHSMGGVVAGRVAICHPGRVRALVLSCTHVGQGQAAGSPLLPGYEARLGDLERMTPERYGEARARGMAASGASAQVLEQLAGLAAESRRAGLEDAMRVLHEADNEPGLAALGMPCLVIEGEHDRVAPRERTRHLFETLPGARLVTIAGAGHAPYLEQPEAYDAAIAGWLERVVG
jgi:pimeloyl-ACP methyl ester carboxylesterase